MSKVSLRDSFIRQSIQQRVQRQAEDMRYDAGKRASDIPREIPHDLKSLVMENHDNVVAAMNKVGLPQGSIDRVKLRMDHFGKSKYWSDLG